MRQIGLHMRLSTTLSDILYKAISMNCEIVQCFLIKQGDKRHFKISEEDKELWLSLRRQFMKNLYLHASYWVNLAGCRNNGFHVFEREIEYAKQLEFTHIIIHPGSVVGCEKRMDGIDALARILNTTLEKENSITIVLENGAHAGKSIGGSLDDFRLILEKIDYPEKIGFCIDTAHAYSYGYDISKVDQQDFFIKELLSIIPVSNISLIHLNDTNQNCGMYIDRHVMLGEGKIGNDALNRFITYKLFNKIPIILELPIVNEDSEEEIIALNMVRLWSENKIE